MSTMFKPIKRVTLVAVALAAVLIPSAALARPVAYEPPGFGSPVARSSSPAPAPHPVAATSAPGFSWHDAGFGAAGALVLVAIGAGGTLAVRRRTLVS
jgi:hypothetical protein